MDIKFHDKIVKLLPSKDLKDCVKAEKFTFTEQDLLKFINDYAPCFDEKLALFREAATVFCDKTAKAHAKKLIAFNEKAYADFMKPDENCVYEITIKCLPDDADEETLITKTFDDAIFMIKSWLKCFKDVGAKDNRLARYTIDKKTTSLPRYPRDIYKDKVGTVGNCVLGYKFKILNLDSYYLHANEINCKPLADCEECKTPCVGMHFPRFPHFLKKYDLVAFYGDNQGNAGTGYNAEINYGIFGLDMEECDNDTYFIFLDNEYIKDRNVDFTNDKGYYRVFDAHSHPSYAVLFKPDLPSVPKDVYEDYLYAVEGLKKIDEKGG